MADDSPPENSTVKLIKEITEREYVKKVELTAFKSEFNGGAFAFNAAGGGLTGIKLEHSFLDPIGDMVKKREKAKEAAEARSNGEHPEQLKSAAAKAQTTADKAITKANGANRRINDLARDINQKLRRKADKSTVSLANDRQNSQLSSLRSSQVAALRREAEQAGANVQHLNNQIARLNSRF
ncbi:hypothetical protein ABZ953_08355 [Streptomyces sp. NPDC046465]|uniref:hypothetical protein n=1 Tax=Streptomyces sp. NPDC046465 TaxID=3155810 RepID=UPI0033C024F7